MKCIDRDTFAPEEYLDNLICCIGYGIFRDPVALPCQHVFCKACIEGKPDRNCPLCSKPFDKSNIKAQKEVGELINMSTAICSLCGWTGQFQHLDKHRQHSCPKVFALCPDGCHLSFLKVNQKDHELMCKCKKAECRFCKRHYAQKSMPDHEALCLEREIDCPMKCSKRVKLFEVQLHAQEVKHDSSLCSFAFAGCMFVSSPEKPMMEHYAKAAEIHLDLLVPCVTYLQDKVERLERSKEEESKYPPSPNYILPYFQSTVPLKWSTGKTTISGERKSAWSFFLSDTMMSMDFAVKVKITKLGSEGNSWKICLGLFTSNQFLTGSWDKFKNGYGYIAGNGEKIHVGSASAYGKKYGMGDIITIEYKNKSITFYKNGVSQKVAFSGVHGPFYLAAALSDREQSIEILEVTEVH